MFYHYLPTLNNQLLHEATTLWSQCHLSLTASKLIHTYLPAMICDYNVQLTANECMQY